MKKYKQYLRTRKFDEKNPKKSLEKNVFLLKDYPQHMNDELYSYAMSCYATAICVVPKECRSENVIRTALMKNGLVIKFLDDDEITTELCFTAVQNNGLALRHIKVGFQTAHMCMEAVKQNIDAVQYVKAEYVTQDMINYVLPKKAYNFILLPITSITIDNLKYMMEKKNYEFIALINNKPKKVAERIRTEEMCLYLVNYSKQYICLVPKNKLTLKIFELVDVETIEKYQLKKYYRKLMLKIL